MGGFYPQIECRHIEFNVNLPGKQKVCLKNELSLNRLLSCKIKHLFLLVLRVEPLRPPEGPKKGDFTPEFDFDIVISTYSPVH